MFGEQFIIPFDLSFDTLGYLFEQIKLKLEAINKSLSMRNNIVLNPTCFKLFKI